MSFEISIEDRVRYYFGNCSFEDKEPLLDDRIIPDTPFRTDQDFSRIDPNYQIDMKRYMSYTDKPFWIQWGSDRERVIRFSAQSIALLVQVLQSVTLS